MPVELTEQVLPLNGIDLHVTQAGTGAPLLMIHGVTVNASFEAAEITALAETQRVIAPDLRGHGHSTRPARYALADHVADMLALLDALEIEQAVVLGASMGSYIAQALALEAPERVTRLILVVPAAHGETSSSARVLAEHAEELAGLTREEQQMWLSARMFAPETPDAVRQAVLAWYVAQQEQGLALNAAQLEAANAAVLSFDFRPQLPGLNIPTLVISGRHDILNPPAEGQRIAELLPDARFEVFEHAGHLLSWEQPERYVATIRDFLAESA